MSATAQLALPCALLAILAVAVRYDLRAHRIPNLLVVAALACGLGLNALMSGVDGLAYGAQGTAVGLLILLPFHLMGGMGAGDVKLMAAVGSFLGPIGALLAAGATLLLGACLALCLVIRHRQPGERFPYAVAIGGGAMLIMWQQGQLMGMATAFGGGATP